MKKLTTIVLFGFTLLFILITLSVQTSVSAEESPSPTGDHRIGFESLDINYIFRSFRQPFEHIGINISSNGTNGSGLPRVIETFGTASPGHALRNDPQGEFGSAYQDLIIDFDFLSDHAVVYAGKDETSPGTVQASFQAWRTDGSAPYLVDIDYTNLPASIVSPVVAMSVQSNDNLFNRLVISYGSTGYSEIIDNLIIDVYEGPLREPPPDTVPPRVVISTPENGDDIELDTVAGYIEESRGLDNIMVTVSPSGERRQLPLPVPSPVSGEDTTRYYFADLGFDFRDGSNTIVVSATDEAGLSSYSSITFTYSPPTYHPPPTDWPDTLDISANSIEVTQVIQGWGDVGPTPYDGRRLTSFVAGKQTLARVYGQVEGVVNNVPGVNCQLQAFVGGVELSTSPIYAPSRIILVPGEDHIQQRLIPQKTCNFILPTEWTIAGNILLRATVNPYNGIPEGPGLYDAFNSVAETITFHDTERLCVHIYRINSRSEGDVTPTRNECFDNIAWMQQIYPVAADRFEVSIMGRLVTDRLLSTGVSEDDEGQLSELLDDFRRSLGLYYGQAYALPCNNTVYLGLTDDTITHRGITAWNRPVSLSVAHPTSDFFRMKTAHESGHALELGHVQGDPAAPYNCDDPAGPYESYPRYTDAITGLPYFQGSIGDWGWAGDFDSTTNSFRTKSPFAEGDMMSYCSQRWMSSYTWEKLFDLFTTNLDRTGVDSSNDISLEGENDPLAIQPAYFIIGGVIDDNGIAQVAPVWTQRLSSGSSDHIGSGPLTLQLLDIDSQVLFTRHFTAESNWDVGNFKLFREIVPAVGGTYRITLSGTELASPRSISAGMASPVVTIIYPAGGESWPAVGSREILWRATDTDDDALTFTVMYSHDSGQTWQVIGSDIDVPGLVVDLSQLPGCDDQCRIRVLASDDINQGTATSGNFSKDGLSPLISIIRPESIDVFAFGQHINFEGLATDREDGTLSGNRLSWHSDLDGDIGSGSSITFFRPSPGLHQITLTARDSDGMDSKDTIGIYVMPGNYVFLPIVVKD